MREIIAEVKEFHIKFLVKPKLNIRQVGSDHGSYQPQYEFLLPLNKSYPDTYLNGEAASPDGSQYDDTFETLS